MLLKKFFFFFCRGAEVVSDGEETWSCGGKREEGIKEEGK